MSDYSKSIVYKLGCKDTTVLEFYIGSSYDEKMRKKSHKTDCNNENSDNYNFKVYEFMRANGGYENWKFEVIEKYPCENKIQLKIRERYYYDLLKPLLNIRRPFVSEEERKEQQAIRQSKHYQDNKEYYAKNDAKYREEHKEQIAKYREDNKDIINHKNVCECGGKYTSKHISTHCKSKKHIAFIEKKNQK